MKKTLCITLIIVITSLIQTLGLPETSSARELPTYTLTATNWERHGADTVDFDIYMLRTGNQPVKLSMAWMSINLDHLFWNYGQQLVYITCDLPNINMTCGMTNDSLMNIKIDYEDSLFFEISNEGQGTKIAAMRLVSRNSTFGTPRYIKWNGLTDSLTFVPTTITVWIDRDSVDITNHDSHFMEGLLTNISVPNLTITPVNFTLNQNYPNPFNPTTTITYQLKKTSYVSLRIYDEQGKEIKRLVDGIQTAGDQQIQFNASHLSSGTYFYKIQGSDFTETKKMILIK